RSLLFLHSFPTRRSSDLKGYQYEPDQFVIIEPEDLDKLKLKSTKVIEIEGFVDATEVPATLYDAPYYAGPDGDVAAKTFALLIGDRKSTRLNSSHVKISY